MSKIKTALRLLKYNRNEFLASILMHLNFLFPDKLYLTLLYRLKMGYWIDWKNPKTFSEKLQWLKLYDRKPEYTTMVDKYAVKEYVGKIIGEEYIIPKLILQPFIENAMYHGLEPKIGGFHRLTSKWRAKMANRRWLLPFVCTSSSPMGKEVPRCCSVPIAKIRQKYASICAAITPLR